MRKTLLPFLFISIIILSCGEHDPIRSPGEHEYFPLKVGNYWQYQCSDPALGGTFENEITGTTTINNQEYYVMITKSPKSVTDTTYYRMDDRGYVFEFRKSYTQEMNKYRLNARKNDSWEYTFGTTLPNGKMTFNGSQNVTLTTTTIDNCKAFSFDVKQWVDEESHHILAAGIGLVVTSGDIQFELKHAVVNEQEFNF